MTTFLRNSRFALLAALLTSAQACKKDDTASTAEAPSAEQLVSPENIAVVKAEEIRVGPSLSGSLSAETQSTVRSEVSGAGLQTMAEVGGAVHPGQDLGRPG